MEVKICAICAAFGATVGALLGGVDGLVIALLAAVSVDYITGVLAAAREKKLSSEIGFWGLVKKMMIFLLVGLANLLDTHVLGGTAALRAAVIFFYMANESLSILENFTGIGLPFPEKLKDTLARLKDK